MVTVQTMFGKFCVNAMTDISTKQYYLRPMTTADLGSVLALRNHSEIRRYMLTQHEISLEEHASWFDRTSQMQGIELLVLEVDGSCCGFVQFKETKYSGVSDWGFYVAPNAPKGTGRNLGLAALNHVFKGAGTHKICGQALHSNKPSIEFHKSLGFMQEGVMRDQHFDGTAYHDLYCFGLIKHEWIARESNTGKGK